MCRWTTSANDRLRIEWPSNDGALLTLAWLPADWPARLGQMLEGLHAPGVEDLLDRLPDVDDGLRHPSGTSTYESEPAVAFGQAVRAARVAQGIAQDEFAARAGISRSHMGKIERGEHVPALPLILKIAMVLRISSAELIAATERNLGAGTILEAGFRGR